MTCCMSFEHNPSWLLPLVAGVIKSRYARLTLLTWYRFRTDLSPESVQKTEDDTLDSYDFALNDQRNGKLRWPIQFGSAQKSLAECVVKNEELQKYAQSLQVQLEFMNKMPWGGTNLKGECWAQLRSCIRDACNVTVRTIWGWEHQAWIYKQC